MDLLYTLLASRKPTDVERGVCMKLLSMLQRRYEGNEQDALALLSVGQADRDDKIKPAVLAAWAQLSITVLASDVSILLY